MNTEQQEMPSYWNKISPNVVAIMIGFATLLGGGLLALVFDSYVRLQQIAVSKAEADLSERETMLQLLSVLLDTDDVAQKRENLELALAANIIPDERNHVRTMLDRGQTFQEARIMIDRQRNYKTPIQPCHRVVLKYQDTGIPFLFAADFWIALFREEKNVEDMRCMNNVIIENRLNRKKWRGIDEFSEAFEKRCNFRPDIRRLSEECLY